MPKDVVEKWAMNFCHEAKKDDMKVLRDHLRQVGLPDEPERLVHGTVLFVEACCAYLSIDAQPIDEFLAMQSYHPTVDVKSHYSFIFNAGELIFGRIIAPLDYAGTGLDLVDLSGHSWEELGLFGYTDFRVARLDEKALSTIEIVDIEKAITYDIRYDYDEREVGIIFDKNAADGVLLVSLEDMEFEYNEEDDEEE